jgi:hypothetical protein
MKCFSNLILFNPQTNPSKEEDWAAPRLFKERALGRD